MLAAPLAVPLEHLTPHDLVAYFRCPHEMELEKAQHAHDAAGAPVPVRTPADVVPLRHSPLMTPPLGSIRVTAGRLAFTPGARLVYQDDGEDDLPVLFPPEQVHLDPRFRVGRENLVDPVLGIAGRPDLVVALGERELVPLEYKATHLFVGYHQAHGRLFDTVQAIAQCHLVEATFGQRPPYGIVLYGDAAGDGQNEGWVEVPYGEAEAAWLRYALKQVRSDSVRAPVPAERNCGGCEPNGEGRCRYAAARYEGPHHRSWAAGLQR
ncbi:MAG TPA: hypothetical protein VEG42_03085 [Thermoplasmata archaeon]|nr:hypothetical protein [Thermoplasmata archaeon]